MGSSFDAAAAPPLDAERVHNKAVLETLDRVVLLASSHERYNAAVGRALRRKCRVTRVASGVRSPSLLEVLRYLRAKGFTLPSGETPHTPDPTRLPEAFGLGSLATSRRSPRLTMLFAILRRDPPARARCTQIPLCRDER